MNPLRGFSKLSDFTLRAIRDKIESGSLQMPLTKTAIQAMGFGFAADALESLGSLGKDALLSVFDLVLSERQESERTKLDLVWTGPETAGSTARDTWVVIRDLFDQAEKQVLIAGYSFDHGKDLFEPLHHRMKTQGLKVQFFLDIPRAPPGVAPEEHAKKFLQDFLAQNWPFGTPYPNFYYDPRTVHSDSLASLHAKCVVIDEKISLVGSANFTNRGQTRNIELGVLIHDIRFSREVVEQWIGLVGSKLAICVSK